MGIPGQKPARRRTFCVEALESRELLSTAGAGTHGALAAAPGSQVAMISSANQVVTIKNKMIQTKLQGHLVFHPGKITFSAGGFVAGLHSDLTPVLFRGSITKFTHHTNNTFTFHEGGAEFVDQTNHDDFFV